jgi:alkylhydroperoxidase family enzyme
MGHTEMLLAVAGLNEMAVRDREARLASGDWSSFPPQERAGLRFAYRITKMPWSIRAADLNVLKAHYGPERAIDVVWYLCWCNYMTRVADAFQIPLEKDNVFDDRR